MCGVDSAIIKPYMHYDTFLLTVSFGGDKGSIGTYIESTEKKCIALFKKEYCKRGVSPDWKRCEEILRYAEL